MSIRAVAAAAVLILGLCGQATAQDGAWRDFMPPMRRGATLVHDTARDRYLMFAGMDVLPRNDLWVLPADSSQWRALPIPGLPPFARVGAASAYDEIHDRFWMYGGLVSTGDAYAPSGGLFALDFGPEEWSLVAGSGGSNPTPRAYAALLHDPTRDRLLLYGGMTNKSNLTGTSEVWAISPYAGEPWSKLSPGTPPAPRWNAIVVYDRVGDRMIVLGGQNRDSVFTDAWQLKFSPFPLWSRIITVGDAPPQRQGAIGILDAAHGRIVTFGGVDRAGVPVDDIWSFALTGLDSWTRYPQAGDVPNELLEACATLDSARARIVVHGGGKPHDLVASYGSNETWFIDIAGDEPHWGRIVPAAPGPSPRFGVGAALDLPQDAFLIFGGLTSIDGTSAYSNELWRGSLSAPGVWTPIAPAGPGPAARHEPSLAIDAQSNRAFVFGGRVGTDLFGDTWTTSLDDPAWRPVATSGGPEPRRAQATAWDPSRRAMFVFGGQGGTSMLGDAWELSTGGTIAWRRIQTSGDGPAPRGWASAVYDPHGDRMIVYGGVVDGKTQSDVWALSLGGAPSWTRLDVTGDGPDSRARHSAAYDPARRRMLVWGGFTEDETLQSNSPGTWALALDGPPVWTRLETTGPEPYPATSPAMVFDLRRDRMVTYGGSALFDDLVPDLRALEFTGTRPQSWLEGATVDGTSVRVAWQTLAAPGTAVVIEKRVDSYGDQLRTPFDPPVGEWDEAAQILVESDGSVSWTDAHVGTGGSYSYRLNAGGQRSEVTSVSVPGDAAFSLESVLPSPTTGPLVLAIRSSGAAPVWASLYDANGRRVLTRELGVLPAGLQSIPLELPVGRRAGVYFVRVSQGGSAATRKIVVL